ncbi:unnamed protein product [Rotaria sp. Silwood1]|nr:unnamed protein product [Rotaria sp. Silwood1]
MIVYFSTANMNYMFGEKRGADTDSQVYITLFGNNGKRTNKIHLKNSNNKDLFKRRQADKFCIKGDYIGESTKPLIKNDNIDLSDSETTYFAIGNEGLAKDEFDRQIFRDLILNKQSYEIQKNNQYKIIGYIENERDAGTDANVFITLYSNLGLARDWFLNRILIEDVNAHHTYEFPCNRWLAQDEDDKQIARFLFPKHPLTALDIAHDNSGFVSECTNAQVILVLYGDNRKSRNIKVERNSDTLQQGHCDKFKADINDVGIPFKLRVSLKNKNLSISWHLDRV